MRALIIFGSIALYITCAFVPPSEANVRAMASKVERVRHLQADALISQMKEHAKSLEIALAND